MLNKKLTTANVTVKNDENQQMVRAQQRASTSSWCLELAIAKRCRLNKLIRQRFAFAIRFSRLFRAKIQQKQLKNESAAKQLTIYESWMSTAERNSNGENDKKQSTLKMERING
ncbi:putative UDP-3-O-acylglucosamine N-acyltransferase 2, mitochondrial [Dorcoceras hygrometricum]|uniref:Putative UDP-3-O-acylglucosamine N-acyltransferase 2, mitochondrial n=1 Tax=Dorcoceras hygrometricum TaxID=472368 RepID=A0A2Z6ZYG7_9LAMI|nr:putative UDP-3-O-acylglucosamine N-acyltransferase 2, mitochondrial [Dorcoceras hygrometricum]